MDNLSREQRRKNMQNIRSCGTLPENLIMKELRKRKIYFASHVDSLPGKPDIVFRKKKIAVFIDSDFWHGRPGKFVMPATNRNYWETKIANNRNRDMKINRKLRRQGWTVLRLWEKDIRKNITRGVEKILKVYRCKS